MKNAIVRGAMVAALAVLMHDGTSAQTLSFGNTLTLTDPSTGAAADLRFVGGFGQIDFGAGNWDNPAMRDDVSNIGGPIALMNVINASLTTPEARHSFVTYMDDPDGIQPAFRVDAGMTAPSITELTLTTEANGSAALIHSLALSGSFSLASTGSRGSATGGVVQFSNLRVDVESKQVIADLTGTRNAIGASVPAQSFSSPGTVVWTFDALSGASQIQAVSAVAPVTPVGYLNPDGTQVLAQSETRSTVEEVIIGTCYVYSSNPGPAGEFGGYYPYACPKTVTREVTTFSNPVLQASLTLSNLKMSDDAQAFVGQGLGLQPLGRDVLQLANSAPGAWGDMRVGAFFQTGDVGLSAWPGLPAAIPEPSTYALMGLGLVGVAAVARRKARTGTQIKT